MIRLPHPRIIKLFACAGLLGALFASASCNDGDTVLALNTKLLKSASSARTLAVSITQPGQSEFSTTLTIETKETDAGTVLKKDTFFHRIVLPESFTDAEASVRVVAKDAAGADLGEATGKIALRPAEAIAGYVSIGEDPPPPAETEDE
jgi:hypothetical protein